MGKSNSRLTVQQEKNQVIDILGFRKRFPPSLISKPGHLFYKKH